jgi:REP element-mobilizing transposase RayT
MERSSQTRNPPGSATSIGQSTETSDSMANTFSKLLYHVIFSTKHREPLVTTGLREDLYSYIGGIVRKQKGMLVEIGGMPDHLHLVIRVRPDLSVAEMLRLVKANSSKWVNERTVGRGRFAWQEGYAAFTVSASQLPGVCQYVQTQADHHRSKTFQEEYIEFLRRHEIEYDEAYLWV